MRLVELNKNMEKPTDSQQPDTVDEANGKDALAAPTGSIVPFNEAKLDQIEKPTLIDGLICDLPGNRRVEVWRVKEDEGYCIRIFRPTNDGKTSKLVFGLKPPAAMALMQLLSKQLSNDQALRPAK